MRLPWRSPVVAAAFVRADRPGPHVRDAAPRSRRATIVLRNSPLHQPYWPLCPNRDLVVGDPAGRRPLPQAARQCHGVRSPVSAAGPVEEFRWTSLPFAPAPAPRTPVLLRQGRGSSSAWTAPTDPARRCVTPCW